MTEQGSQARLLVVCRANVCRSPMAEFVAAGRFAGTDLSVSSAGTDAAVGQGLCRRVESVLSSRPAGPEFADQHRVTPLSSSRLWTADLILTTSPRERSRVALAYPWLRERTFTLIEAERLLATLPMAESQPGSLWELSQLLHQQRWIAASENWPRQSRNWKVFDRQRPASGLAVRDAHEAGHRSSHARVLQYTETLVGHISDEILVRLGVRSRENVGALQMSTTPDGDSRRAI